MDHLKKIKQLLDKFYDGQTSLEEELYLEEYFTSNSIPEELLKDKELFVSMNAVDMQVTIPGDLNSRLIDTINEAEHKESRVKRINLYSFSGLAAGLLIILGVYFAFLRDNPTDVLAEYTIQDEDLAYQEARKALNFVSAKLNRGTVELQPLQQVTKSIQSLKPLQKLSSGSKELQLLGNLEKAGDLKL
jgi:hypothetical protein